MMILKGGIILTIAITTTYGHVARALDFTERTDLWFKLGRKNTPWDDELNPDIPLQSDQLETSELLGLKKVETLLLVVPDEDKGTLVYRNKTYRSVTPDKAFEEGAKFAYLAANIAYDEFPTDSIYRQIALASRVKAKSTVDPTQRVLLPEDVDDFGIDEIIDNRKPIYRDADQREKVVLVIEF